MTLHFHPAAADELDAAVAWYLERNAEVAARFVTEARRRVVQAARLPKSGPLVQGIASRFDARAFGLREFPYRAVVAVVRGERVVVALAHTSRAPGYWRERLR